MNNQHIQDLNKMLGKTAMRGTSVCVAWVLALCGYSCDLLILFY